MFFVSRTAGSSGADNTLYQYTLSVGYDLTSTIAQTESFNLAATVGNSSGLKFNPDGTKFYVSHYGLWKVWQFSCTSGTPFDIASASFDTGKTFVPTDYSTEGFDFTFFNNGLNIFMAEFDQPGSATGGESDSFVMTTAYDISTAAATGTTFDTNAVSSNVMGVIASGAYLFQLDGNGQKIYRFNAVDNTTYTDEKAAISNVPDGTLFEETDTRTTYWREGSSWLWSGILRGVFGGGQPNCDDIDYFTIQTLGNAADFGDLTADREFTAGYADSTRGIFHGGGDPYTNVIDYITVPTLGDATDFGDLTGSARREMGGCADATRGCVFGGTISGGTEVNTIEYTTIQTIGNATDFGDLTAARASEAGCADATRGICAGGYNNVNASQNWIEYITIQSTGNSSDFGDLLLANYALGACADSTRGVIIGGNAGVITNVIQYLTIATTGNTTDFGDLTIAKQGTSGCADSTRGVCGGGYNAGEGAHQNVMEYITIQTTGNGTDFGDLVVSKAARGGLAA